MASPTTSSNLSGVPQLLDVSQWGVQSQAQWDGEEEHFWLLILSWIHHCSPFPQLLSSPCAVSGTPAQSSGGVSLPDLLLLFGLEMLDLVLCQLLGGWSLNATSCFSSPGSIAISPFSFYL